jgi:hypothetical protein
MSNPYTLKKQSRLRLLEWPTDFHKIWYDYANGDNLKLLLSNLQPPPDFCVVHKSAISHLPCRRNFHSSDPSTKHEVKKKKLKVGWDFKTTTQQTYGHDSKAEVLIWAAFSCPKHCRVHCAPLKESCLTSVQEPQPCRAGH